MTRSAFADLAPAMDALQTVSEYLSRNEKQFAAIGSTISELTRALDSPWMRELASAQHQTFLSSVDLSGVQTRAISEAAAALTTPSFLQAISAKNEVLIASLDFAGLAAPALSNISEVFRTLDANQA